MNKHEDCYGYGRDGEPCWGRVEIIDEDNYYDQINDYIDCVYTYACEGHSGIIYLPCKAEKIIMNCNCKTMAIAYKKVHPLAKAPVKAHETDACWDLFTTCDVVLLSGETGVFGTGLVFDVPVGYCLKDYSRSGLAAKFSLSILNSPGVIDAGYVGEVSMIIHNHGRDTFWAPAGSKMSQVMLEKLLDYKFVEGEINTNTLRGENGLGSTGV